MDNQAKKQWDGKSRGGRFGYEFFVSIIRIFGVRCAYCFLAFIVIYFIPFAPKATKAIWQYNRNIRHLNIFRSIKELYCHYFVFGQTLIDKVAMKGGLVDEYEFKFENFEEFLQLLNGDKGLVLIGAHIGCWEAGSAFFGKYGKKINIVMFDSEHQQIKEVIEENSESSNNYKIIAINKDPIQAMIDIKVALNNGEYICFNGDRYIDKNNIISKTFMGKEADFPIGPFKIASRCRVPVVFYYSMREANKTYKFIFEEPKFESKIKTEDIVNQYVTSLENIITKYPRQWFNFYDFWK